MLTIFNKQKQKVGGLQTSGYYQEVWEVTRTRRLNSDYNLTFNIPMDSTKYSLLEEEGLVECEGQKYIIKQRERKRQGMGRQVQFTCQHVMRRLIDIKIPYDQAQAEALGKDISFFTDIISAATGGIFTFQIMDTIDPKDIYKWGFSNCLQAFQDLVKAYQVEFVPDNYNIKIYKQISIDNGRQFRYAKNLMDGTTFQTNTNTLTTRLTGLAKDSLTIIDLPASYLTTDEYNHLNAISGAIVGGIIKVPYIISQYADTWATPDNAYFDGQYENTDIDSSDEAGKAQLLDEMRKQLAQSEIPDIQIQLGAADLWKNNSNEGRPELGETVYPIDKDMQMDNLSVRIMELTEYPFDLSKNSSYTVANYILKDENDIMADLNASKNLLSSLMTNKQVNTSTFEAFAQQAINDINASKSQVIYDDRGIVLQETGNALHQVIMTANGIVITTDGGMTANTAITAQGIAAEFVTGILGDFAYIKAQNIDVTNGKITAAQIDATNLQVAAANVTGRLTAAQIDATNLQVAAANITGQLTAAQINATNLHVSSANIDGAITADSVKSSWVYAGNISANQVNTGTLSGVTINVSDSANIGEKLILSGTSFGGGIQWGNGVDPIQIYIDPVSGRLTLHATSVYANSYRLDQAQTFVWG